MEFNKIKHLIDKYGFGILKSECNTMDITLLNILVKKGFFTETNLGFICTIKSLYKLNMGKSNSDKVKKARLNKEKIWSYSELEQWNSCELSYKLQRIDKIQQKHSAYALYGTLAHDIQENYILGNIDKKNLLKEFKKRLKRLKDLGVLLPRDFRGGNSIQVSYETAMKDYFKNNYTEFGNLGQRTETEVFDTIDTNYIIGYIDYLKINKKIGKIYYVDIIDFKTSSMYSKGDFKDKAKQLLLYKILLEKSFNNIKVENVYWDFMKYVIVKFKGKEYIKERKTNYLEPFRNRLIKELGDNKIVDIDLMIKNLSIPKEFNELISVSNCYVGYDFNENTLKELEKEILQSMSNINKGIENNIFNPKNYDVESFFCNNLCGFKENCPHLENIGVVNISTNRTVQNILDRIRRENGK